MSRPSRNEYTPDRVSLPGETLQEVLDERCISRTELAEKAGESPDTIRDILKGKAAITPRFALELERILGVPAAFWSRLEQNYREYLARTEDPLRFEQLMARLREAPL